MSSTRLHKDLLVKCPNITSHEVYCYCGEEQKAVSTIDLATSCYCVCSSSMRMTKDQFAAVLLAGVFLIVSLFYNLEKRVHNPKVGYMKASLQGKGKCCVWSHGLTLALHQSCKEDCLQTHVPADSKVSSFRYMGLGIFYCNDSVCAVDSPGHNCPCLAPNCFERTCLSQETGKPQIIGILMHKIWTEMKYVDCHAVYGQGLPDNHSAVNLSLSIARSKRGLSRSRPA